MGWFGNGYLSEDGREPEGRGTHAAKRHPSVPASDICVASSSFCNSFERRCWPGVVSEDPSHFAEGRLGASGQFSGGQRCCASLASPCAFKRMGQMGCCDELAIFLGLVGEAG